MGEQITTDVTETVPGQQIATAPAMQPLPMRPS